MAFIFPFEIIAKEDWDKTAQKKKSEYIYLEALAQDALENTSEWADLVYYAYGLSSDDINIANDKGFLDYFFYTDSATAAQGYALMEKHFNTFRNDKEKNIQFAAITIKTQPFEKCLEVCKEIYSRYPKDTYAIIYYADVLTAGDTLQNKQALDLYNKLESINGKAPFIYNAKINTHLNIGDTIGAKKIINSIIENSDVEDDELKIAQDAYLNLLKDTIGALDFSRKTLEVMPYSDIANYLHIALLDATNDSIARDKHILNILNNDYSSDIKIECIGFLIREYSTDPNKMDEINKLMTHLIEEEPNNIDYQLLYSTFLIDHKDFANAMQTFENIVKIDSTNTNIWAQYIILSSETKDPAIINKIASKALEIHPDNYNIAFNSGLAYSLIKDKDNAITNFLKAKSINDNNVDYLIGDTYASCGELDSAYYYYDLALAADSTNDNALNNYAYHLSVNNGDLNKAEKMSYEACQLVPNSYVYLETYAWIKFLQHDHLLARSVMEIVLETISPENYTGEILHHAGDIFFMTGDHQKALEYWEKALMLEPDNKLLKKKLEHKTFFYE